MKIVVIGGSGLIGTKVVAKLRDGGHEVNAASPATGVNTITGEGDCMILSGGGGARVRKLESSRKMPYGSSVHGFTHLAVSRDGLTFTHHGVDGGILHRFTKRLDGKVEFV